MFGHEMPPRNQAVPQLLDLDGQDRAGQHHGDRGGAVAELLRRNNAQSGIRDHGGTEKRDRRYWL